MNILITGATGTIGRPLCNYLINNGYSVTALTRNAKTAQKFLHERCRILEWNPVLSTEAPETGPTSDWTERCGAVDVAINLAGEPIADKRWSKSRKVRILESRIGATRTIVNAIQEKKIHPHTLVNASAIGYYAFHPERVFSEDDSPGDGFLSQVCVQWEAEALKAESPEVRVVRLRLGIVLSKDGGTLKKMVPAFKMFFGGYFGNGSQWFSWVHINDVVFAIQHIIENKKIHGPVNVLSPNPTTNKEFARAVGKVLRKPAFVSIPRFAIWLRLGELADLLYESQRVSPKRLLASGFTFQHEDIEQAVEQLLAS